LDHFDDVWERLPVEEEKEFSHPGGKVFLMDSGDVPGCWLVQPSVFVLPRGRYRVMTSHSESDAVYIIVHHLEGRRG
jgi:hypothetical protein